MSFSAHNIQFPDGSRSIPERQDLTVDGLWMNSAMRVIDLCFPGDLNGRSIVDLGCLEGGYTAGFAQRGLSAKGIEVRKSNFENCIFVREKLGLSELTFENDDVWNLSSYGSFDISFCCGLLYHLDRPREFLSMMSAHTRSVLIINTHFAPLGDSETFTLSPITENEGLPGRWYPEHETDDLDQLEAYKWTSWLNKKSFWLTRAAVLQSIKDCGFDLVFEQFDSLGDDILTAMNAGDYGRLHRSTFVGVRTGSLKE